MKKAIVILIIVAISSASYASNDEVVPHSEVAKAAVCLIKEYFRQNDELTATLAHIERQIIEVTTIKERNQLRLEYINVEMNLSILSSNRRSFLFAQNDSSDQEFYAAARKYYPELAKQCGF